MMQIPEILAEFEWFEGRFARKAVEEAVTRRDEIVPELLRILEDTVERAEEVAAKDGYMAHLYALYLLAQFREPRAYPIVVRFASLPGDVLDSLCGDFVTEGLGSVLASVCDGDLAGIQSLIEDPKVYEWARSAALGSLVTLVAAGVKSREEIVAYFAKLFRGGFVRKNSEPWGSLVNAACDLCPEELVDDIRKAYDEDLVDPSEVDWADVRYCLRAGKERTLADLSRNVHHRMIEDTAMSMGRWSCFEENKNRYNVTDTRGLLSSAAGLSASQKVAQIRNPLKVGRNDPCPCGSGKKYKKCCGA